MEVERPHPLSEQNWAGALCKSQNTLEVVLGASYSGFWHINTQMKSKTNYQLLVRVSGVKWNMK
jgi:hypothetical protein